MLKCGITLYMCYQDGPIEVEHIDRVTQLADLLIKPLNQVWFETLHNDMGVRDY